MKCPGWRTPLGWILAVVLACFIGLRLADLWPQIISRPWHIRVWPFIFSVFFLVLDCLLVALTWLVIVQGMGDTLNVIWCLRIFFYSSLGRYVPGKIWPILAASAMAQREQGSGLRIGTAVVYLGFLTAQVGASLALVGLATIPSARIWSTTPLILWSVAGVVAGLACLPNLVLRLIVWAGGLIGRQVEMARLPLATLVRSLVLILLTWLVDALACHLLIRSLFDLPWHNFPQVLFSTTFSTVMGFLAFFVPAGIGVRDGALLVAFTQFMPAEVASAMSVIIRLWFTVVDVGVVVVAVWVLSWLRGRNGRPDTGLPSQPDDESPCVG
jgi:glycosyltransferase 2 family protein